MKNKRKVKLTFFKKRRLHYIMAKKITIALPNEVGEHLLEIKELKEVSLSGVCADGIELLYWAINQQKEGYVIKAVKNTGGRSKKILLYE